MSTFSGKQGKGARRELRVQRMHEAHDRQVRYRQAMGPAASLDPQDMLRAEYRTTRETRG